ncbi:hypothetical protein GCM10017786_61160 [Amycolatopsis deserti]|uniref:Fumarylacetoacetase-like C-terminal domain-containing protein n=1 Tax=Amycolatopsis deserti TaxID=185696 RepID=A0ABQ3JCG3_9PSEU|nr:hypothetical protein GCM10017786_61160 [Amycolatopsis deserti]
MRIGNLRGRAHLVRGRTAIDIAKASGGLFGPEPADLFARWPEFVTWAATARTDGGEPYRPEDLGAPVPRPRQVFAVGLNYAAHAAETGLRAGPPWTGRWNSSSSWRGKRGTSRTRMPGTTSPGSRWGRTSAIVTCR